MTSPVSGGTPAERDLYKRLPIPNGYNIGSRVIDHRRCTRGTSGAWYPNFGEGVEIFGWQHDHADVSHD